MKKILIFLICAVLLCGCGAPKADNGKLRVVATIFPLYDFARAIGGEKINLKLLIDPGTEVHSYDPAPSDIRAIYGADLFCYIGGESDEWVNSLLGDINVDTFKGLDKVQTLEEQHIGESERGHSHGHSEENRNHETDEHIWTSPENALILINSLTNVFCELDGENAAYYRKNAESYCREIRELQGEMRRLVAETPEPFILVADRFPFLYFAVEFGISYEAAFGGCAISADISMKTMKRLIDTVNEKAVSAAYFTEMSGKTVANALSEETGTALLELQSGHNVTLKEFNAGITYADILRQNIIALQKGWQK